ncbi:hypothetical protein KIL84_010436 [Mauremys mutica]|uniref:Uncharacterized protein n=1 Tax=Mauremys mutica TaxID=74926 RepID=A0A9D3XA44_9SAUR|nr:hypothetical protein KIL84_010436 [Mauremys mutica]
MYRVHISGFESLNSFASKQCYSTTFWIVKASLQAFLCLSERHFCYYSVVLEKDPVNFFSSLCNSNNLCFEPYCTANTLNYIKHMVGAAISLIGPTSVGERLPHPHPSYGSNNTVNYLHWFKTTL